MQGAGQLASLETAGDESTAGEGEEKKKKADAEDEGLFWMEKLGGAVPGRGAVGPRLRCSAPARPGLIPQGRLSARRRLTCTARSSTFNDPSCRPGSRS